MLKTRKKKKLPTIMQITGKICKQHLMKKNAGAFLHHVS